MVKLKASGRRTLKIVTIVVCVLLGLTAIAVILESRLDSIFRSRYDEQLDTLTGFDATVGSAQVFALDRSFEFHDIVVRKQSGGAEEPYFRVDTMRVELTGSWLRSSSRMVVTLTKPIFHLVKGGEHEQLKPDPEWRSKISADLPYEADELVIRDGKVVFVDTQRDRTWKVSVSGSAKHLVAGADPDDPKRVHVGVTAELESGGQAMGSIETKTGMKDPPFDLRAAVRDIPIEQVEGMFRERFGLSVSTGLLTVMLNASGENGQFRGDFLPILERLDLKNKSGRDSIKSQIGEWVAHKLEDPLGGQSARVEIAGTYGSKGMSVRVQGDPSVIQQQLVEGIAARLKN